MRDYFETEEFARSEDSVRVKMLSDGAQLPEVRDLRSRLQKGLLLRKPEPTLASCLFMREVRFETINGLLDFIEDVPNERLRVVTVINRQWRIGAAELLQTPPSKIKGQFRTHLNRAKVSAMPGPLVGFLHGEFEPRRETYQLHYHLLTTKQKAQGIFENLRGRWGYENTATGACPIKRQEIEDRPKQLSYLLKSYWPQRPVYKVKGRIKRRRSAQRIVSPHHTLALLWLDWCE